MAIKPLPAKSVHEQTHSTLLPSPKPPPQLLKPISDPFQIPPQAFQVLTFHRPELTVIPNHTIPHPRLIQKKTSQSSTRRSHAGTSRFFISFPYQPHQRTALYSLSSCHAILLLFFFLFFFLRHLTSQHLEQTRSPSLDRGFNCQDDHLDRFTVSSHLALPVSNG